MNDTIQIEVNSTDRFLKYATVSLVGIALAAVALYSFSLDGKLSGDPSHWEAFGSYVGGVLGPMVSFIALVAVLRTITLQREALGAQRLQFAEMKVAQDQVLAAQAEQLQLAQRAAASESVNAYKASVLTFIEHHIGLYRMRIDRIDARNLLFIDGAVRSEEFRMEILPTVEELRSQQLKAEKKLNALSDAVSLFLIKQHKTIQEIQADFASNLMPIFEPGEAQVPSSL